MKMVQESIDKMKIRIIEDLNPGLSMLGMCVITAIFGMLGFTIVKVRTMLNKSR
jgi:hypothetical protein